MSGKLKAEDVAEQTDETVLKAQLLLQPSINAAVVITSYQSNIVGKDVDFLTLVDELTDSFGATKDGDLSNLEAMLIGQATALQSIFVSLAKRAQGQQNQKNFASLLGLALKAQTQSRATIQAVVELKFPRQVSFVKQANISHGPQQVNNGQSFETNARSGPHAEENQFQQNKLLEDTNRERTHLDARATTATSRSNPAMATVGAVHRTKKRRG